jgi:choline kinase
MDALILAAGLGSRLQSLSPSKPLTLVHGVSLLEISLRQLACVGVKRAMIVTGHRAEMIDQALERLQPRLNIELNTKRVECWNKPNGYSVMAGSAALPGDYLLVMCDHILSTQILWRLAGAGGNDRDVTLAIDRRTESPLIDPEDATWVELSNDGFIKRIGKSLAVGNAVDCGAFLATPALADAIRHAVDQGRPGSLSDGMQVLADRHRAATFDIGEAWWLDVDDPAAHRLAETELDPGFALLEGDEARSEISAALELQA